ncbi:site-2 protease family protein [Planktothricoides sp. FACHB-1370]|uniref:Site-2 protease family protein n=3 Tax=Planktothricoides raciborskii TaxID=132608 RepID=A0AAU8JIR5_9CYAN|nr:MULTISPECIES: site-2 protease family protein [Planktothricoides]KOR35269.1 peptidase M50 [Planktothricoides sp. SR001]MBD2543784.1 site-2 protease family protein [Planktothricoides raciborskii FACHB-1370]MBD2582321.1 site-2 protease family protein [Planktothricoides raciborskii FACHB-1261]
MVSWLLILILGLITYIILRQRVTTLTRTPVWILWLVLMTPAFVWIAWYAFHDQNQSMPPTLVFGPFVVCFFLYWFLVQWGRQDVPSPPPKSSVNPETNLEVSDSNNPETATNPSEIRALTLEEEKMLRDCFPWTMYPLHKIDYRLQAAICRGQLRAKSDVAYAKIKQNIEAKFGDRFLVIFQEDFNGKPLFVLVPNPQRISPKAPASQTNSQTDDPSLLMPNSGEQLQSLNKPGLAIALALVTLFTTTLVGAIKMVGIEQTSLQSNPNLLLEGLPYSLTLMLIIGSHEYAHFLTATFYQIQVTLPYFIPFPEFIGTFGAFMQIRQPMPNRKILFDVSIVGPICSFLVTIPILMWGMAHSTVVPLPSEATLLSIDALNPSFSLLLTILSKISLPSPLGVNQGIDLHPVAVSGYIGLILTAFNLMPVGSLDGGHIVHAMFGQKMAITIGQITRFLFFILAIAKPELLIWAIYLFLIPVIDSPALNDVTELDNKRDILGLIALLILVIIIIPAPKIFLPM